MTVVLELGARNVRVGVSGEASPYATYRSAVGLPKVPHELPLSAETGIFPLAADKKLDQTDVVIPLTFETDHADVLVEEEALLTMIYGLRDATRNLKWHSVVVIEPSYTIRGLREYMTEILFDKIGVEFMLPIKAATSTVFACARTSGIVLDFGHARITASAVQDGLFLSNACRTSPIAGSAVLDMFDQYAQRKWGKRLPPMYECLEAKPIPHPFVEETFRSMSRRGLIEELLLGNRVDLAKKALPDGVELQQLAQDFDASSLLLTPTNWAKKENIKAEEFKSASDLKDLIYQTLSTEGVAGNVDLVNSICLTGGLCRRLDRTFETTLQEQMSAEQVKLAETSSDPFVGLAPVYVPQWQKDNAKKPTPWGWRFIYAKDPEQQRAAAWIGGSILGSLGVYETVAATRQAYSEHGIHLWSKQAF